MLFKKKYYNNLSKRRRHKSMENHTVTEYLTPISKGGYEESRIKIKNRDLTKLPNDIDKKDIIGFRFHTEITQTVTHKGEDVPLDSGRIHISPTHYYQIILVTPEDIILRRTGSSRIDKMRGSERKEILNYITRYDTDTLIMIDKTGYIRYYNNPREDDIFLDVPAAIRKYPIRTRPHPIRIR